MNRNKARQQKRNQKTSTHPKQAPEGAQEPRENRTKLENIRNYRHIRYGKNMTLATLNTQGMKAAAQREMIEQYMKENNIKILAVQETHITTSHIEKTYTIHMVF